VKQLPAISRRLKYDLGNNFAQDIHRKMMRSKKSHDL
jgi:hypothetical protein